MTECFFSSFIDELPGGIRTNRSKNILFRAGCTVLFFLVTLPMVTEGGFYLFNLIDVMIGGFPLLFVGFFELLAISYIYGSELLSVECFLTHVHEHVKERVFLSGFNRFSEDIALMLGSKPGLFWKATWCFVSPIMLTVFQRRTNTCTRLLR